MAMRWFKRSQVPQQLTPPMTRFVGEQDGPSERDLKASFDEFFRSAPMVERAYLARAEHGDGTGVHVTLAIKCSCGEDKFLVSKLAKIFATMFGSHEHLDINVRTGRPRAEMRVVCTPFYRASVNT
jgi:hypothetical protein